MAAEQGVMRRKCKPVVYELRSLRMGCKTALCWKSGLDDIFAARKENTIYLN
jgi:hypothetical protein